MKKRSKSKSRAASPSAKKGVDLGGLLKQLNSFTTDNYWDLGRFIVDKVLPTAERSGMREDQVLRMISSQPGMKFPLMTLRQCEQFYTYYPDVRKRALAEIFYFALATKVDSSKVRDEYESMALKQKWTISELRKRIHDDELAQKEEARTRYGFDLRERNIWSFDIPDPRFGKTNYKGRLPGQIVANSLFYCTNPGNYIIDPFAGGGTLGDIIDALPYFKDRRYKMYDLEPSDERIYRNNILLAGIPEQSETVDYVFLDPPAEFLQRGSATDLEGDVASAKADFILKFKGIARECSRVLKPGGRVSVIVEPVFTASDFVDFPLEMILLFGEFKLRPVGKVYLPHRTGDAMRRFSRMASEIKGARVLTSDCRELLTFQK
ncbi:MAG: hypothetical protein V3U69_01340 [Bacteroidota bacterium]